MGQPVTMTTTLWPTWRHAVSLCIFSFSIYIAVITLPSWSPTLRCRLIDLQGNV